MANIKKSFNFRNGVQVDDDNLKVSATGLVGIGTTVPTEALDVRGSLVVSGITSAVTLQAGVATITTLNPTEIIGAGVSIKSGIVTASSGIITYFGDGINLLNLPTSQWEDTIVGAGVSSIYNTGGNVGIATTAALFTLQIGNDVNSGQKGVGISSFGDIKASGITTASGFVGPLTGDVTGNVTGNLTGNVTGNVTGNITGNITGNTQGIHTGAVNLGDDVKAIFGNSGDLEIYHTPTGNNSFIDDSGSGALLIRSNNRIILGSGANIGLRYNVGSNVELTHNGIQKFQTESFGATVNGELQTDNLRVSGVSTFAGRIEGAMTNNVIPFLYSNLAALPNASDYHGAFAHVHSEGRAYFAHAGQWWELVNKEADGRIGTGTEEINVGDINSAGIVTCGTELNTPICGIGTNAPAHDIQVRKSGNAEIQVTSDTGIAGITVGREPAGLKTNNAEFRYGGGAGAPYSTTQSLDIINYGTDNFNYYLSANNPNDAVGDFHWHKGLNSSRMMTLTKGGNLGIGETQPQERLTVAGVCTVTSNSFVGANLNVSGNSTIGGNLTVDGTFNVASINTNIIGNVTGNLTGLVNATSGVSTFFKVGINTDLPLPTAHLDLSEGNAIFKNVGIGSTEPDGILDVSGASSQASKKFILLPKVSAGGTSVLQSDSVEGGALIYNTTLRKLQFYNGTNWETVTSVEVTG